MYDEEQLLSELKSFVKGQELRIREISTDRNYWFMRTQGGSYFEEFFFGNYIAIGWDDVPFIEREERTEALLESLSEKYKQPNRVLNQVFRFCKELKKNDIVVIPSESSLSFAFGRIEDDEFYTENIDIEECEEGKCPFTRRRKVVWVSGVPRSRVDPKLYAFFRNQQALTSGNVYADFIERALSPFYIKDNIAHFTLSVETPKSPNALDIPTYMQGILFRVLDLSEKLKIKKDMNSNLDSRINVQSEGIIELLGEPCFVLLAAVVTIALFGGTVKFRKTEDETSGEMGTDGLAGFILKIMNKHRENPIIGEAKMREVQERLNITDPRDK